MKKKCKNHMWTQLTEKDGTIVVWCMLCGAKA